jgi:hypothetical protein
MSDEPLTNAAVEFYRRSCAIMNAAETPPTDDDLGLGVSSDFMYESRSGIGVDFGRSDWPAFLGSIWHVGGGRPRFSEPQAIAVRGQRCAAITASFDYGNDSSTEYLHCVQLDPELQRLERIVSFEVDDRDAAIAELDRMYAEFADEPHTPS